MKRCPPIFARVPRLPHRSSRASTTSIEWRRPLSSCSSNSHREMGSPLAVRRRQPSPSWVSVTRTRAFASSSRSPTVTREDAKKLPVAAEQFDELKQFLMKPAREGDTADRARAIVSAMMEHHVYPEMSGQEAAVMSMVADAMEDAALVVNVYKCLRRARVAPSPMTLELTAEACAATGDWQTAHDVVEQMHEAVDIMHPSIDIYENAVRACHVANKWMQGKQLLEAIARDRLEASPDIHLQVIETCLVCRELTATSRLVQDFFSEFPHLEHEEVEDALHGLLGVALDHQVLDHALFFRDQLAQRQMAVSRETYEALIQLSATQGKWHSARVLLAQLTQARALPTAAPSYQFTRDTQQLLNDMHEHGLEIPMAVYNAALRAYGGQTTLDKAEKLVATMKQRGIKPDTVSYAAVICSCGSDVETSQRYFDELCDSQLPMSMDAFHAYVLAASRAKAWPMVIQRYKAVKKLSDEHERKQIARDARILSCVAVAYGHLEMNDEMLKVFTGMKIHGLVPNLYVYAEAMNAYTRKGQWRHALMLFDHMWTEGIDKEKLRQFPLPWDAAVDAAIVGEDNERLEAIYRQVTTQHGRLRPHTAAKLIENMRDVPTEKVWSDFLPLKYIHERRNVGDENQRSWQVVNAVLKRAVTEWDALLAEKIVRDAESALTMRRFNAMTYSLMLSLYARRKNHSKFLHWCDKMASGKSRVTAYTTRALLLHLRSLVENGDEAEIDELSSAMAKVMAADEEAQQTAVDLRSYSSAAGLARKVLDAWEALDRPLDVGTLEEYVALCESPEDLEDVFCRLERDTFAAEDQELPVITPEFVHAFFLSISEIAPHLQPRLRVFLMECLETQPSESALAALGVFCSSSPPHEIMELFRSLVDRSEDGDIDDEQLVVFLASSATGGDIHENDDGQFGASLVVDSQLLHEMCQLIRDSELSLGAGSITYLLRVMLSLSRGPTASTSMETLTLAKQLLADALAGSSRDELRAFMEEISNDPSDLQHIDDILSMV